MADNFGPTNPPPELKNQSNKKARELFTSLIRDDKLIPMVDPKALVVALQCLYGKILAVLENLERMYSSLSAHELSIKGATYRIETIRAYAECYKSLSLLGRWELSKVTQKFTDDSAVLEVYQELEDIEEKWSKFVEKFEEKMAKEKPAFANEPLKVGDGLPEELLNYEFKDIRLEKMISLKDILSQSKNTLFILLRRVG